MLMLKKTFALAAPLAALTLLAAPPAAEASNYPPDYDFCGPSDTVYTGPFELIRDTLDVYHAKLTVAYDGYLRDYYPDNEINIYIWLNGNDAFLPASAGAYDDAYIFLNAGPRGCVWCSPGGVNQPSVCDGLQYPQYSSGKYVCADPSSVEQHLFSWAFGAGGVQNAWDIYVAAESHGSWDSNYGSNFYARFEPRVSCY